MTIRCLLSSGGADLGERGIAEPLGYLLSGAGRRKFDLRKFGIGNQSDIGMLIPRHESKTNGSAANRTCSEPGEEQT